MEGEVYKAFQVGITYRLLEQLLFYDRIYIDLIEVPIFLNVLNWIDTSSMKEILKDGLISYVNCYDINLGVTFNNSKYFGSLAIGMGEYGLMNSLDEFRAFVFERYEYKKEIDSVLKYMFENSIDFVEKDFRKLVKQINNDIKDKEIREQLGIKSISGTQILKRDVPIINALSFASRNLLVSEKIGINNLYSEDIILDVMEARYSKRFSNGAFKFNQLLKNYQIPDIELLLFFNKLKLEDLLVIRESKDFKLIKKNILTETEDDRKVLEVLMNVTNNRLKKSDFAFKMISLMSSTLAGLLNPIAGIGVSAFSEVNSTLKNNNGQPTLALEKVSKFLKENSSGFENLPNVITTRARKQYIVK